MIRCEIPRKGRWGTNEGGNFCVRLQSPRSPHSPIFVHRTSNKSPRKASSHSLDDHSASSPLVSSSKAKVSSRGLFKRPKSKFASKTAPPYYPPSDSRDTSFSSDTESLLMIAPLALSTAPHVSVLFDHDALVGGRPRSTISIPEELLSPSPQDLPPLDPPVRSSSVPVEAFHRPTSFGERLDARVQREQEHYGQGTTELLINTTIPAVASSSSRMSPLHSSPKRAGRPPPITIPPLLHRRQKSVPLNPHQDEDAPSLVISSALRPRKVSPSSSGSDKAPSLIPRSSPPMSITPPRLHSPPVTGLQPLNRGSTISTQSTDSSMTLTPAVILRADRASFRPSPLLHQRKESLSLLSHQVSAEKILGGGVAKVEVSGGGVGGEQGESKGAEALARAEVERSQEGVHLARTPRSEDSHQSTQTPFSALSFPDDAQAARYSTVSTVGVSRTSSESFDVGNLPFVLPSLHPPVPAIPSLPSLAVPPPQLVPTVLVDVSSPTFQPSATPSSSPSTSTKPLPDVPEEHCDATTSPQLSLAISDTSPILQKAVSSASVNSSPGSYFSAWKNPPSSAGTSPEPEFLRPRRPSELATAYLAQSRQGVSVRKSGSSPDLENASGRGRSQSASSPPAKKELRSPGTRQRAASDNLLSALSSGSSTCASAATSPATSTVGGSPSSSSSTYVPQSLIRPLPDPIATTRPSFERLPSLDRRPSVDRRPSTSSVDISLAAAFDSPLTPIDFPWKTIPVAEAKRLYTPQQLQEVVMQSIRKYGEQTHRLVVKDVEGIPAALEEAIAKLLDVQAKYQTEIGQRAKVLVRHVACLRAFNGQEGGRFAESLVNAVARSDRLAQELCLVTEHIGKVEHLQDSHWRAAASLSLAKLNASFMRSRQKEQETANELARVQAERDEALERLRAMEEKLKQFADSDGQVVMEAVSHLPSASLSLQAIGGARSTTPESHRAANSTLSTPKTAISFRLSDLRMDIQKFPQPPSFRNLQTTRSETAPLDTKRHEGPYLSLPRVVVGPVDQRTSSPSPSLSVSPRSTPSPSQSRHASPISNLATSSTQQRELEAGPLSPYRFPRPAPSTPSSLPYDHSPTAPEPIPLSAHARNGSFNALRQGLVAIREGLRKVDASDLPLEQQQDGGSGGRRYRSASEPSLFAPIDRSAHHPDPFAAGPMRYLSPSSNELMETLEMSGQLSGELEGRSGRHLRTKSETANLSSINLSDVDSDLLAELLAATAGWD